MSRKQAKRARFAAERRNAKRTWEALGLFMSGMSREQLLEFRMAPVGRGGILLAHPDRKPCRLFGDGTIRVIEWEAM